MSSWTSPREPPILKLNVNVSPARKVRILSPLFLYKMIRPQSISVKTPFSKRIWEIQRWNFPIDWYLLRIKNKLYNENKISCKLLIIIKIVVYKGAGATRGCARRIVGMPGMPALSIRLLRGPPHRLHNTNDRPQSEIKSKLFAKHYVLLFI
jgi:hypothetical protein